MSTDRPSWSRTFVCGAIANSSDLLTFGHPLDRVRVHMQAHPDVRSARVAAAQLHQMGGVSEFYKGIRWNLAGALVKGATRWTINNGCDRLVKSIYSEEFVKKNPIAVSASIGLTAAFAETTFLVCPFSSLKVREMTRAGRPQMGKLLKAEGFSMLFNGWNKTFVRHGATWVTYLVAYEKYKQIAQTIYPEVPLGGKFLTGAATGATAAIIHLPFDVLMTQAQKEKPQGITGVVQAFLDYKQKHGLRKMYRSLPIKLVRSGWYSASTLLVMDWLNALPSHMQFNKERKK